MRLDDPLSFGPAGQVKLLATITPIRPQHNGCVPGDQQRRFFRRVARFFGANAKPCPHGGRIAGFTAAG
jgi:hypothetical protein